MKYLQLTADYTQSPLKDEYEDFDFYDIESLPEGLAIQINSWDDKYKKLLPLNYTLEVMQEGTVLDEEGRVLAKKIEEYFGDKVKVKYISAL